MESLSALEGWPVDHAAAAVVDRDGVLASTESPDLGFAWASVTKLVTALAVLRAAEAGAIALDEPAGPPGSTVRHLLAHASGLGFEGATPVSRPGATRIYSNSGFDALGALLAERVGPTVEAALGALVLEPLAMAGTTLAGRPSEGLHGPLRDLARLGRELLAPTLLPPAVLREATRVAFPGLRGILPAVGRFDPLDWGLGFEIRDGKRPHWTGSSNAPATFGHFGGSGSFLWVDPEAAIALAVLTDRTFGPWALEAWPALSDAVLAEAGAAGRG